MLLDDSTPAADCGGFEIWTILHFDTSADPTGPRGTKVDPKRIPVAIPCTELTRPQYDKRAGNAGVLVKGKRYVLGSSRRGRPGSGATGSRGWRYGSMSETNRGVGTLRASPVGRGEAPWDR